MRWTSGLNLLGMLLFAGFAAVQYNDPDPLVWILAYGYVAMLCLMASLRVRVLGPALAGAVVYALLGTRQLPRQMVDSWLSGTMDGRPLAVEEVREAFGLYLASAWCLLLTAVSYARGREARALAARLQARAAGRPRAASG
jgi:hypothetical protein